MPNETKPRYTPAERMILDVLADGMPHSAEELAASYDDQATDANLANHLTRLRKKLNPIGHDILHERNGKPGKRKYRLVRLTRPDHV